MQGCCDVWLKEKHSRAQYATLIKPLRIPTTLRLSTIDLCIFSTILASGVPSGGVLGVSWAVLGASCGVREASGAILDRLGGFFEVVLALLSRLLAVLDRFDAIWGPKGGAGF